jgi:GAF domain-containing protein
MDDGLVGAFALRLRDLLATLESAVVLGASESRVRGLGEQLQFACMALPCGEALVALERAALGRLQVPGVATADSWRPTELEFLPGGTPFAYLLGGGDGYAVQLDEGDELLAVLQPVLTTAPRHAVFIPIRVGGSAVGGAALLREDQPLGDAELAMAERLAEVLALTVESHRTERALLQLFAAVLPDLFGPDAGTDFASGLERYLHRLRIAPVYRRRLELAEVIGRLAVRGPAETRLAREILEHVDTYIERLTSGENGGEEESFLEGDDDLARFEEPEG